MPRWRGQGSVLLAGGAIMGGASAMLIDGDTIAWLGDSRDAPEADRIVDLDGCMVTPGFVDAHVHATSTGLTLAGLDLSGADSLDEALRMLSDHARTMRGAPILGHGWDETRWPEGRPPTTAEVDRASWGSVAYLSRIDVHSAAVSSALRAGIPQVGTLDGFSADGPLTKAAHHAAREAALSGIGGGQRQAAQRRARQHAASLGIVAMHEMAGPSISSEADLEALLALAADEAGPVVVGYWGQLARDGGLDVAERLGARGAAGDLFVDGAIGSRTACLRTPYADAPDTVGAQYLDPPSIADHVVAATRRGLQAGFHVIGDAACDAVVEGFEIAARMLGADAIRAGGHRIEHAEMLDDHHIRVLADLQVVASMQPLFDRLWGGSGGMYERRLGLERAAGMNRIASLMAAGAPVALGSDAPVTPLGPWAAVRAAADMHGRDEAISEAQAIHAHTVAGWRAGGEARAGVLEPGAPAHYAIWQRAGQGEPRCVRTVVHGRTVYDDGRLEERG